jgi:hypothetical protein
MVGSRGCLRSGAWRALYLLDSPGPVVGRVFSLRDAPGAVSPPTKPPTAPRIASTVPSSINRPDTLLDRERSLYSGSSVGVAIAVS